MPLTHLGPTVVNEDGTISRITNWQILTPAERRKVCQHAAMLAFVIPSRTSRNYTLVDLYCRCV